jgi:hypothetical protein
MYMKVKWIARGSEISAVPFAQETSVTFEGSDSSEPALG